MVMLSIYDNVGEMSSILAPAWSIDPW
jgi:hypothetical protein